MSKMNVSTVVIVDDCQKTREMVKEALELTKEFKVIAEIENGEKALEIMSKIQPDFLLLDDVMPKLDGIGFLERYKTNKKTKILYLPTYGSDLFLHKAKELGVYYSLLKPFDLVSLINRLKQIKNLKNEKNYGMENSKEERQEQRIQKFFLDLGITPNLKGYGYLKEGVKMSLEDISLLSSITKKLYVDVASRYDTTSSGVERSIRHVIEKTWKQDNGKTVKKILNYKGVKKPTNSQFIAIFVEKIKF